MDATLVGRGPGTGPPAPAHPPKSTVRRRGQNGDRFFIRVTTAGAGLGPRDGHEVRGWGLSSGYAAPPAGWAGSVRTAGL